MTFEKYLFCDNFNIFYVKIIFVNLKISPLRG
jgi:hypothetical protein